MTKTTGDFGDCANASSTISLKALLQEQLSFNRKSFKFSKLFVGPLFTSEALQPVLNKQLNTKNAQFSSTSLNSFLSEGRFFHVFDFARLFLL